MTSTGINAFGLPPTFSSFNDDQVASNFKGGYGHHRTDITAGHHNGIVATGPHREVINLRSNKEIHTSTAMGLPSTMSLVAQKQLQSPANYQKKRCIHEPHPVRNIPKPPSSDRAGMKPKQVQQHDRPHSSKSRWKATSISSSEFVGRVEALQLQFQEERKRRHTVERRISSMAADEHETVNVDPVLLTQDTLVTADQHVKAAGHGDASERNLRDYLQSYTPPPSMPRKASNNKNAMRVPSAPSRRKPVANELDTAIQRIIRHDEKSVQKKAEAAGHEVAEPAWLRSRGADRPRYLSKHGPDVRKPSLPAVARGVKSGLPGAAKCVKTHSRKRVDGIEVYTAEKRHSDRMQQLAVFEAQMLGL